MTMNKFSNAFAILTLSAMAAVGPVSAQTESPHVLVMGTPVKGGGADLAVDFYSDGSAIAVNVDLGLVDLAKAGAKTAACETLKLKASGNWQGGCSIVDGVIRFVAINLDMAPLPAGWHSLGTVRVAALPKAGVEGKVVTAANAKGEEIPVGFKYSWVD
jgi:hypothetical protein